MLVSRRWLEEFVDLSGVSDSHIADALTYTGTETSISRGLPVMEKVVVALVEDVSLIYEKSSDKKSTNKKLTLLRLNAGEKVQVVSNLPFEYLLKFRGKKVPVVLNGGRIGEVVVKSRKFGETLSEGALVPADYLFLGEENELPVLPDSLEKGADLFSLLELDDTLFEIEITPNRGDLLSHLGVARELAAVLGREFKFNYSDYRERARFSPTDFVEIIQKEGCPRYSGAYIDKGKVFPTSSAGKKGILMVSRLRRVGYRDINNWVDVTNYVLAGYGQPMHVFDVGKLKGKIVVRDSLEGENFVALDGTSLKLPSGVMVIADEEAPVAVAGVMGGLESGVVEGAEKFFFESAHFKPSFVRVSERLTGLSSESSYRFSRGTDPEMPPVALLIAWELITQLHSEAGADIGEPVFSDNRVGKGSWTNRIVLPSESYISEVLGKDVPYAEASRVLISLGFDVDGLDISAPSFRFYDVYRKEDIVEEVGRMVGYNDIPDVLPGMEKSPPLPFSHMVLQDLRKLLSSRGLYEFVTYSFVSQKLESTFGLSGFFEGRIFPFPEKRVFIRNPLSEETSVMRTSLLSSLIPRVVSNVMKGNRNLMVYEIGRVFQENSSFDTGVEEPLRLAFAFTGDFLDSHWKWGRIRSDFYLLRSVVEDSIEYILERMGSSLRLSISPLLKEADSNLSVAGPSFSDRGVALLLDEREGGVAGFVAPVSPGVLKSLFGEVFELYVAEVDIGSILSLREEPLQTRYSPFAKFSELWRDIAVLVPEGVYFGEVARVLVSNKYVSRFSVFDYYKGEGVEKGYTNLGIRIWFKARSDSQYTDDELNSLVEDIFRELQKLGLKRRI